MHIALLGIHVDSADIATSIKLAGQRAWTYLTYYLALCIAWDLRSLSNVDSYIAAQTPISKSSILANIGPSGSNVYGVLPGVVIASPSTEDPDYFYTWTRDSALVFKLLIDQYTSGVDPSLRGTINDFVASQARIQLVSNPSGTSSTGGLGEPKFNANESAFTENWGRPQRDGPALRSISLITLANHLIAHNESVQDLWHIILQDLEYVAATWNETTFDLWEEVSSSSYFTSAAQHRAMHQGATLAKVLGHEKLSQHYEGQATQLLCFLQSYWNPNGYMTANTGGGRSGKDANTVLASIHMFDPSAACDSVTLQPCSDKALSNLAMYVEAFRHIYSINDGTPHPVPIATGRYPEDIYYTGNPWYLTTLAVAEQLYDALIVWDRLGSLNVTATSQPFFQTFDFAILPGAYMSSTPQYQALTSAIRDYADGFIKVVANYTPADGSLAEQFNKTTGVPTSALNLTWSYAASLTAFSARASVVPVPWGASGLTVPDSCYTGGRVIPTTFRVHAETAPGEIIYLTGSSSELKDWSENGIPLSSKHYPIWQVTVNLPPKTDFEYKYTRKSGHERVKWASDPNMVCSTPSRGSLALDDIWQ